MVRNTAFFILLMFVVSCSEDIPVPGEPEEMEEPAEVEETSEDSAYPVCGFDLDQEGDPLPLIGDWEFVGFEHLETGNFYSYTCTARLAHLTHYQGGYVIGLKNMIFHFT